MLDIHFIRENASQVRENLARRQDEEILKRFDALIKEDKEYRSLLQEVEGLRAKRNQLTGEVAKVKDNASAREKLITESRKVGNQIKEIELKQNQLKESIHNLLLHIPNTLEEDVPFGKDDSENMELKKWGDIEEKEFKIKTHGEMARELNGVDFENAVKISGTGFYALKNNLALLDWALQQYAMDILLEDGFIPMQPPFLINKASVEGVTDLAEFENQLYKIEGEDLYLISTSEHPLVAQFMKTSFPEQELPIQMGGLSPCFRREVGKHGIDERGLFRVHHFNKVEQVVICSPNESMEWHERLLKNAEKIIQGLEIPYRIVNVCTGDIGIVAAKKYDIEGYSPREKKYFELMSVSNCTSYQAVRLGIKFTQPNGTKEYVHTLNGTGVATTRMIRAILENHQQKDGSIWVPEKLRPYMGGKDEIRG